MRREGEEDMQEKRDQELVTNNRFITVSSKAVTHPADLLDRTKTTALQYMRKQ